MNKTLSFYTRNGAALPINTQYPLPQFFRSHFTDFSLLPVNVVVAGNPTPWATKPNPPIRKSFIPRSTNFPTIHRFLSFIFFSFFSARERREISVLRFWSARRLRIVLSLMKLLTMTTRSLRFTPTLWRNCNSFAATQSWSRSTLVFFFLRE